MACFIIGNYIVCLGIDALLSTLRSLNEKVGTYEEEEEFKLLEELLQSNKFRKAKEFHDNMRALVTHANEAPVPHTLRIVPQVRMVSIYSIVLLY